MVNPRTVARRATVGNMTSCRASELLAGDVAVLTAGDRLVRVTVDAVSTKRTEATVLGAVEDLGPAPHPGYGRVIARGRPARVVVLVTTQVELAA